MPIVDKLQIFGESACFSSRLERCIEDMDLIVVVFGQ